MKVLHVLGDSKWGGGSAVILNLARMGVELGWQVDLLATDPATLEAAQAAGLGTVDLDVVRREIRPWFDALAVARFERWLRRMSYDLVHTHTSKGGCIGRVAATLAGVPAVVHTVHGFGFHEQSSWIEFQVYRALETLAAWCCHRVVTVSHFHREWALELKIAAAPKIQAIPNGIPEPRVTRAAGEVRVGLGIAPEERFVLNHSRLAAQKGLEDLIDAVAFLPAPTRARTVLVLAGDGPLRASLERRAAELGLAERVRFTGFRRDIPDLIAACDLVALPSRWEGLSISMLEAMALGKPIVASDIASMQEASGGGQCARLVSAGDVLALANAIHDSTMDPAGWRVLGDLARSRYLSTYTEDKMTSAYRRLYLELVQEKHAPDRKMGRIVRRLPG